MTTKILNFLKVFVPVVIIAVGVSYASAQTSGTWTNPTGTPPNNNTAAPVNVGSSLQQKLGALYVNTSTSAQAAIGFQTWGKSIFTGAVQIIDGSQGSGKILTSDANGNATWAAPASASVIKTYYLNPKSSVSVKNTPLTVYNSTGGGTVSGITSYATTGSRGFNADSATLNRICAVLTPDAPIASAHVESQWGSPGDNPTIYWSAVNSRFELRATTSGDKHLGNTPTDSSPSNALTCTSQSQVTTQL